MSDTVPFKHRGKNVGRISKDGATYETTRVHSIHYVRRHDGYGIQRSVLRDLLNRGVKRINLQVIKDDGKGRSFATTYLVAPQWWLQTGLTAVLNERDGTQVFVTVRQLERAASDRDHFQNHPTIPDCRPCQEGDHHACNALPFLGFTPTPCACHNRGHRGAPTQAYIVEHEGRQCIHSSDVGCTGTPARAHCEHDGGVVAGDFCGRGCRRLDEPCTGDACTVCPKQAPYDRGNDTGVGFSGEFPEDDE